MIAVPHSPAKGISRTAIKMATFSITVSYTKGGRIA